MFKKEIRASIWAIFFLSLGGLLLHLRIHSPFKPLPNGESPEASNWIPFIVGLISTVALPFLLNSKKTVVIGYLFNLAAVAIGVIAMAHHSWEHHPKPITFEWVILYTTLADILILLAKVPLGQQILGYFRAKANASSEIA